MDPRVFNDMMNGLADLEEGDTVIANKYAVDPEKDLFPATVNGKNVTCDQEFLSDAQHESAPVTLAAFFSASLLFYVCHMVFVES